MKSRAWVGLGIPAALFALAAAYAWLWAPWRYFTAKEVHHAAAPMHDVGLHFPPAPEGVDYYGILRLDLYIDARGHVDRVEVVSSTVPAAFRDDAVRAFEATPFDPAVRFGMPVKSVKRIEVRYEPPVRGLNPG